MHKERENPHKRFVASKNRKRKDEEDAHSCQPRQNCTHKKKKKKEKNEQVNAQNT